MNNQRIKILRKYIAEDSNDPFNFYAIGLEYLKSDVEKALFYFEKLLKEFPDYVPTYYHIGKLYESKQNFNQSLKIYKLGIEKAGVANDQLALRELKNALQVLEFDMLDE